MKSIINQPHFGLLKINSKTKKNRFFFSFLYEVGFEIKKFLHLDSVEITAAARVLLLLDFSIVYELTANDVVN